MMKRKTLETMPTCVQWPTFTISGPPESPEHESRSACPAQIILNKFKFDFFFVMLK